MTKQTLDEALEFLVTMHSLVMLLSGIKTILHGFIGLLLHMPIYQMQTSFICFKYYHSIIVFNNNALIQQIFYLQITIKVVVFNNKGIKLNK